MDTTVSALARIGAEGLLYLTLLVAAIYALVLAYHWFSYGTSRTTNILSLATYIGGSILIFSIMLFNLYSF